MNRLGILAILAAMAITPATMAQTMDIGPSGENPLGGPASSAPGGNAAQVSVAKAQSTLAAEGYTGITNLKRQGSDYVGQALRNGKSVTVKVNAQTGFVTTGAAGSPDVDSTPAGTGAAPNAGH